MEAGGGHQPVERVDLRLAAGDRLEGVNQAGTVDLGDEPQGLGTVGRVNTNTDVVDMDRRLPVSTGADQERHRLDDHQTKALENGEEAGQLDAAFAVAPNAKSAFVAIEGRAHDQPVMAAEAGTRPRLVAFGGPGRGQIGQLADIGGRFRRWHALPVTGRHPVGEGRGSVGGVRTGQEGGHRLLPRFGRGGGALL